MEVLSKREYKYDVIRIILTALEYSDKNSFRLLRRIGEHHKRRCHADGNTDQYVSMVFGSAVP